VLTAALLAAGGVGTAGILIAAIFGRPLLTALYTPEFGEYAGLLTLQMVASCCAYLVSVLECALNSVGCFDSQFPTLLGTTVITAMSVMATLPAFGIAAIPVSMTGTYLLHGTVSAWLLRRAYARRDTCK
jgi:O-antigen/teichoic acid export membrane protein